MNTYKNQMQNMIAKANKLSADEIKDQVIKLNDDMSDHVDHVLTALLNALENKIPIKEFVSFCDSM
jgi:hypothetical protein